MTTFEAHWRHVWEGRDAEEVSWFEPSPDRSHELIRAATTDPDAPIIDVGGGASRLVDVLLADGYRDLTVLDIAEESMAQARERLGAAATSVSWIGADVLRWTPPRRYLVWHDRAVLHFLVDAEARVRYAEQLRQALAPGGHAAITTFAPDGPTQCSGLPVHRFGVENLASLFGPTFTVVRHGHDTHRTPGGDEQRLVHVLLRHDT